MEPIAQSLFTQLERSFCLLTAGPEPLAVDGGVIGHGLPKRRIPMDELRGLLLDAATDYPTRDAVLRVLVWRARAEGGAAMIGLVGVLLPGLVADARPLVRACPQQADDLVAEIVTGLVAAIRTIDLDRDKLAATLIGQAISAGRAALDRMLAHGHKEQPVAVLPPAGPLTRAGSHPDLLLDQAVADGVLSPQEADLISEHRINGTSLEELAARAQVHLAAMQKRRQRAERALLAWLAARRGVRHLRHR